MRLKLITAACALTLAGVGAYALQPKALEEPVAVFVASNIKLAVDNAISDLRALGLDVDSAEVKRLVLQEVTRPYDAQAHRRASEIIEKAVAEHAAAASQQMLRDAAARPGARVFPSGLVFETITEGKGKSPIALSTIAMRYTGKLPDGSVFDAIAPSEAPLESKVSDMTTGMAEALLYMRPGGTYRITIPPALAYGAQGIPGVIPPDCTLEFIVDLIEVK